MMYRLLGELTSVVQCGAYADDCFVPVGRNIQLEQKQLGTHIVKASVTV